MESDIGVWGVSFGGFGCIGRDLSVHHLHSRRRAETKTCLKLKLTRRGGAGRGLAWRGNAWHGTARHGMAGHGLAWLGVAWF